MCGEGKCLIQSDLFSIAFSFIALHTCCIFYKLKARPSTSKTIMICFITILTLLWWSRTKLEICQKYACNPETRFQSLVSLSLCTVTFTCSSQFPSSPRLVDGKGWLESGADGYVLSLTWKAKGGGIGYLLFSTEKTRDSWNRVFPFF